MSRIPRFQEHLKTGFTAEAVSAARYRAYAARAEQDGKRHLAARWLRLAAAKDALAIRLLQAAEQVRGLGADLGAAIAEERYENDVLYPRILRDLGVPGDPSQATGPGESSEPGEPRTSDLFRQLLAAQGGHLQQLEALRRELTASTGDVQLPPEVDAGSPHPPSPGPAPAPAVTA